MGPLVCSLVAVCVLVCVTHLAPVQAQCTTKYCTDDDSDENVQATTVARLQNTVDHLQATVGDLQDTVVYQEQQFKHTLEKMR